MIYLISSELVQNIHDAGSLQTFWRQTKEIMFQPSSDGQLNKNICKRKTYIMIMNAIHFEAMNEALKWIKHWLLDILLITKINVNQNYFKETERGHFPIYYTCVDELFWLSNVQTVNKYLNGKLLTKYSEYWANICDKLGLLDGSHNYWRWKHCNFHFCIIYRVSQKCSLRPFLSIQGLKLKNGHK